eukprot:s5426_g2.t1
MWSLHILACDGSVTRMRLGQRQDDGQRARARDPWGMWEIKSRFFMSYISNGLYRAILVYTLPLWLCRGSLVDFVLNAFALVYIVELDMRLKDPPEKWEVNQDQDTDDDEGSPQRVIRGQHLDQLVQFSRAFQASSHTSLADRKLCLLNTC